MYKAYERKLHKYFGFRTNIHSKKFGSRVLYFQRTQAPKFLPTYFPCRSRGEALLLCMSAPKIFFWYASYLRLQTILEPGAGGDPFCIFSELIHKASCKFSQAPLYLRVNVSQSYLPIWNHTRKRNTYKLGHVIDSSNQRKFPFSILTYNAKLKQITIDYLHSRFRMQSLKKVPLFHLPHLPLRIFNPICVRVTKK